MLALVLGRRQKIENMAPALRFWQIYRQGRVDKVLELNNEIDQRRMPSTDVVVGEENGLRNPDFQKDAMD